MDTLLARGNPFSSTSKRPARGEYRERLGNPGALLVFHIARWQGRINSLAVGSCCLGVVWVSFNYLTMRLSIG